jgi:hypothetical protein
VITWRQVSQLHHCSNIIPHELPATIIEIFHRLISGIKDYPVMPYGLFTMLADPFNLSVPEILKMVVIICVQFMFSHFDSLLLLIKYPFPIMFKCKITHAFDRYGHTVVNLLIFFSGINS